MPRVQQPARNLPPHKLGDFVRPEFQALYKAESLEWAPSDRYVGRSLARSAYDYSVFVQLVTAPSFDPQTLDWQPRGTAPRVHLEQRRLGDFQQPSFSALYDPQRLEWTPSDRYAGRTLQRALNDQSVLLQLVVTAVFDPQNLDWQPRDRYFGRVPARALVDWSVLQGEPIVSPIPVEPVADTHDGVGGGARIIYKRPHKKLHDEIEEYFAHIGIVPTQEEVSEVAEVVTENLPNLEARSEVAKAIRAQVLEVLVAREQTQELRELMARAQDEDDAIAVLVMMETLH